MSQEPRRKPFYGWTVVGALAVCSMFMGGLVGLNYGLFIPHMVRELKVPQSYFGWALAGRSVGAAMSAAWLGRLLDRIGPRWLLAVAAVVAGALVVCHGLVTEGWQLVSLAIALGVLGFQGGNNLYTSTPVAKWFVRHRGRAMSVAFVGGPASIFIFPNVSQWLIQAVGWRSAWMVLGVGCGLAILLVAVVFLRRRPEDLGLHPDGAASPPPRLTGLPGHPGRGGEVSWTRAEALRSRTFWKLVMVFGIQTFGFGTMGIFRVPHFIEQGVSPDVVALALSAEAVASLVAGIPVGWALDRFEHRFVAVGSFVMIELAFFATMFASTTEHTFLSTMLFGMGAASFGVNQNVLWPAYFGSAHIGGIRGASLPVTLAFSVFGSPLTGLVKDTTGSYMPAWWVATAAMAVAGVLLVFTPKPAPPPRDADA